MDLNEYQRRCLKYDIYQPTRNPKDPAFMDKILGIVGESGEVADKIKKNLRDKDGDLRTFDYFDVALELGDVLWYIAELAHYLGFGLEDVATMNLHKLADRQSRDTIHGSGDHR